jgi:thiol-disulfide isomerase/thioredoxin
MKQPNNVNPAHDHSVDDHAMGDATNVPMRNRGGENPSLKDRLDEVYARIEPDPEWVRRMTRMAGVENASPDRTRSQFARPIPRRGFGRLIRMGMGAAIVAFAVWMSAPAALQWIDERFPIFGTPKDSRAGRMTQAPDSPNAPVTHPLTQVSASDANLVAMRIHANWCPRCPRIAPIFEKLHGRFASDDLHFVTFDVTNKAKRRDSEAMLESLDMSWAEESPFEPGMIKLVDRASRRVLATLTDEATLPRMEDAIAKALKESRPAQP